MRGQTAIVWAATEGNVEAAQELIKAGANFKIRLNSGMTPLLLAVREGKIEMVRLLLKSGADVNETLQIPQGGRPGGPKPGRAGQSALHIAVENAHYELAAFLLDSGADPNASGPGYTALHAIPSVRKPGGGDNDPAPDGSGNMTSLELIKKLVAKGREHQRAHDEEDQLRVDEPQRHWRDSLLPGRAHGRCRADALFASRWAPIRRFLPPMARLR